MNPALWLLMWLKLVGLLRRWGRTLRSPKGLVLSLVGLLIFIPWLISLTATRHQMPVSSDLVHRFGPHALLAYGLLTLIFSTGERLIYFTPAEVAFLFPGPFRQREILAYKLIILAFATLITSVFFSFAFSTFRSWWLASFIGVYLALVFFQLIAIMISLITATVGAVANTFRRRAVLGILLVLVTAPLFSSGGELFKQDPQQLLRVIENSKTVKVATAPFVPFINTFAAERAWPDLFAGIGICLTMIMVVVAAIFALNATYLEAIAASSEKTYAKIQHVRRGGSWSRARKATSRPPRQIHDFPWLGGVGPTFWRQILSALRDPVRLIMALVVVSLPASVLIFTAPIRGESGRGLLLGVEGLVIWVTMFLTPMIPFDFRGDIDRMETLKTLPVPSWGIAIGQMLTPSLILSLPQLLVMLVASVRIGRVDGVLLVAPFLVFPASFLIIGIENLLFLLFPTRILANNPGDFAAFGRQILLVMAKMVGILVVGGMASLAGVAVYYIITPSVPLALVAALVASMGLVVGLVPLIAMAFDRYDVARDTPA